jgi:hypothetical protein
MAIRRDWPNRVAKPLGSATYSQTKAPQLRAFDTDSTAWAKTQGATIREGTRQKFPADAPLPTLIYPLNKDAYVRIRDPR